MISLYKLAKISVFCILIAVGAVMLGVSQPVSAASDELVGRHQVKIGLNSDGTASVTHKLRLRNNTERIFQAYQLSMPYQKVFDLQVRRGGNRVSYKLVGARTYEVDLTNKPLFPGAVLTLKFTYKVDSQLKNENGLLSFYLPRFSSAESLAAYTTTITYPKSFPQLSYVSNAGSLVEGENKLVIKRNRPIKIVWGTEWGVYLVGDTSNVVVTEADETNDAQTIAANLINLVPDLPGQQATYQDLTTSNIFYEDNANIWADATTAFEFKVAVSRSPESPSSILTPSYEYAQFALPEELAIKVQSTGSNLEKLHLIYDYLVENAGHNMNNLESFSALESLDERVPLLSQNKFTSLEVAYIFAGYLTDAGIPHRLTYGYFYGVTWPGFNEQMPHIWLEANVNGEVLVFDPFLEMATNMNFGGVKDVGRIKFGYWDPEQLADNLLGLAGPGIRNRPSQLSESEVDLESILALTNNEDDLAFIPLEISVSSPTSVNTMQPYAVDLTIYNNTDQIVPLSKIYWDAIDFSGSSLEFTDRLKRAVAPFGSLTLKVDGLAYNKLFQDGHVAHKFTVVPASLTSLVTNDLVDTDSVADLQVSEDTSGEVAGIASDYLVSNRQLTPTTTEYQILYVMDFQILGLIFTVILLAIITLGVLWYRWERQQRLVKWYEMRQTA